MPLLKLEIHFQHFLSPPKQAWMGASSSFSTFAHLRVSKNRSSLRKIPNGVFPGDVAHHAWVWRFLKWPTLRHHQLSSSLKVDTSPPLAVATTVGLPPRRQSYMVYTGGGQLDLAVAASGPPPPSPPSS